MLDKLFDLRGKRAFVTGSSRGIGRAIAIALGRAGAEILFHGTKSNEKLLATVAEAKELGINCSYICGDLGNNEDVAQILQGCGEHDILVLNASVQSYTSIEKFDIDILTNEMRVNLGFNFELIQHCIPAMLQKKWGRIVAISSVNAIKPTARLSTYSTTKAALVNLMINCAKTYGPDGITANTILPGVILTDRNEEVLSNPEFRENLVKTIPAHRFGRVEDCIGATLLLCSHAGSYITGATLPIAGGMEL